MDNESKFERLDNPTKIMSIKYIKGARKIYFNEALRKEIRQAMQKYFIEEMCDMLEISLVKYNLKDCKSELDTIIEELKDEHYEVTLQGDILTISIPKFVIVDRRFVAGDRIRITNKKGLVYNSKDMKHSISDLDTVMKVAGCPRFKIVAIVNNSIAISPNGKHPCTGWVHADDIAKDTGRGFKPSYSILDENSGIMINEIMLNKDQAREFCNEKTSKAFEELVKNLSNLMEKEDLKQKIIKEIKEYGTVRFDLKAKVLASGNEELIAMLSDVENFR